MQKKLIALAIAGLASSAAFAQSNVQIYGSIDMGFAHRGDHMIDGVKGQNAIDSGISAGNRLGFKGTEDLGNGLKALFTLEAGYTADVGNSTQGGRLFGRQAFVGLTGGFGTAIAGRLYTPHYSFLSTIDPFKAGTVGRYNNTYGNDVTANLNGIIAAGRNAGVLTVANLPSDILDPIRVDNAVAYVSPSFSGFNVTAAYSHNADGQEVVGGNKSQNRVFAVMPRYTNGPIDVALNYHIIKANEGYRDELKLDDVKNWLLGGTYDLGMAKLAAFYSDTKVELLDDELKLKNWMLGVTVPFGKHAVLASYNHSKAKMDGESAKAHQWALGYNYSLSKRTNVYAAYADIKNDKNNGVYERTATVGDATNGGNGYQNGFNVGLKHTF